jgi:hypothetical protein
VGYKRPKHDQLEEGTCLPDTDEGDDGYSRLDVKIDFFFLESALP